MINKKIRAFLLSLAMIFAIPAHAGISRSYDLQIYNLQTTVNTLSASVAAAPSVQTFTASGTWTKPSGLTGNEWALIEVWGAGGGAPSPASNTAGGGGGGYNRAFLPVSMLGATESVTVGAGGVATGNGGASSFGAWLTANGGNGGVTSCTNGKAGGGVSTSATDYAATMVGSITFGAAGTGTAGTAPSLVWQGAGSGCGLGGGGGSVYAGAGGSGHASSVFATSVYGGNAGDLANNYNGYQPGGGASSRTGGGGTGGDGMVKVTIFAR